VGCRSAIHYPGRRLLNRQLVEGSNQAGRIPAACRSTRGGELCWRKGGVCLLWRRWGWRPLLLLRGPLAGRGSPVTGPRVVTGPRTSRRGSLASAALLLVAPTAAVAAPAATIATATPLALALALALATAPTVGGRGGGAAGWRRAGGSGDDEG